MSLPKRRCDGCRFWDELQRQSKVTEGRMGYCRFHAPGRSTLYTQNSRAHWPTTRESDWCGHWHGENDG